MAEAKGKKSIFSSILKLLSYIVIAFVCLITLFLLYYIVTSQIHAKDENYRPGISIYTIVSPSMTPTIKVYDIVVNTKPTDPAKIQIGDIITYKSKAANSEGMTITHRVVAVDKTQDGKYEYMTQGDSNSEPDSLMVTYDQVIGKEIMIIPKAGKLQFLIANQKGWLLLLLIPIGIYLIKEVFKLIDLFGLKRKVTKVVTEPKQETIIPRVEIEQRKQEIRTTLKTNAIEKDAVVKNEKEPTSFLEQYTETKLEVKTNKYAALKNKKVEKKEASVEETITKVETPTKVETKVVKEVPKKKEELVLPKIKEPINDEYEILDTDELTTKIKEYDTKLNKLNKMIADIENIKGQKEEKKEEPKEEPFIEVDNFLKGGKIKVKSIEETKNQKKKINSKRITDPSKQKEDIVIELSPLVGSSPNYRTKIARPESVDIKDIIKQKEEPKKQPKKKKNLNLNPKEVTKVKKNNSNKQNNNNKKTNQTKKRLALNPRTTQKATRNRKTNTGAIPTTAFTPVNQPRQNVQYVPNNQPRQNTQFVQTNQQRVEQPRTNQVVKQQTKKVRKKREPFIVIEKIR